MIFQNATYATFGVSVALMNAAVFITYRKTSLSPRSQSGSTWPPCRSWP